MAKIAALPSMEIIDGYKGTIDYYVYMGIPCVRKWPRYTPRAPHPDEAATQTNFAYIVSALSNLPPDLIEIYKSQAQGTPWAWRDYAVKAYIEGIEY